MNSLAMIAEHLIQNDDYILISHVSPDGDTLGCATALFNALKRLGKNVQLVCSDNVPEVYSFLPGAELVKKPEDAQQSENVVSVDCADIARLGRARELFENAKGTVNVDHHGTNNEYAHLNYVDAGSAAASQIVYALINEMGCGIDKDIATCLYTGIMTDTGNFAYTNTTPKTFEIAAKLVEAGADNATINRLVFRTVSFPKTVLLGKALSKIELMCGGKLAYVHLDKDEIAACGAVDADSEGIIDHLRDIKDVEIAVFIRQSPLGTWKISLRSKLYADVGQVAVKLDGGGHRHAAGCSIKNVDIEEAKRRVVSLCKEQL